MSSLYLIASAAVGVAIAMIISTFFAFKELIIDAIVAACPLPFSKIILQFFPSSKPSAFRASTVASLIVSSDACDTYCTIAICTLSPFLQPNKHILKTNTRTNDNNLITFFIFLLPFYFYYFYYCLKN